MDERGELLDLIYATVTQPQQWVTVMERMTDSLGGNSAWLSRVSVRDGLGSGLLARVDPATTAPYIEYYGRLNPIAIKPTPQKYMAKWRPLITSDDDHVPKDVLIRSEFYNDFLLPQDVHSILMIDLAAEGLDIATVNIHRSLSRGPFDPDERALAATLHPHLIRAFKLGEMFSGMRALGDIMGAALDRLGQGVFILDAQGRILRANHVAERLLGLCSGLDGAGRILRATRPGQARRLEALIAAAASPDPVIRIGGSMTMQSAGGDPLSITVAPYNSEASPVLAGGPAVFVSIANTRPDETALRARLSESFALTAAEVRVAMALLNGATPRRAADMFGVSVNTIRSQMASIFGKTGTAGQAELSRLMVRLANSSLQ